MPTSHHIPRRPIPRRRSLALLGLFTASALSAQPAPTAARVRRVADSLITRFVSTKPVPGLTVAMVRDGDTLVLGARGRANLELDVPMRTESVLRIGSITKQFTAVQVLQLVDAGRVRLDDPVGMYLPAVPGAWHAVTVRQLLNHTSGLPNYTDLGASWRRRWGEELAPDTIVALASARPADFAPGTSWRYNNTGYILLGMLVAERSGRPWAQDLEQRLTTPLGLRDTRDCQNQPVLARRASGYAPKDKGYVNAPYLAMTHPYAGGAMCSTVRDLLRWQAALHGGRLLSPASYRAMTTPEGAAVARHYGFGIERDTIGGRTMLAHGGWVPGFVSYALYVPEARLSVVILTNGDASTPDDLARNLARAALGVPLAAPARPAVVAAADLTPYLGRYAVTLPGAAAPQGFEVRREGDRLVIHADGQPPAVMTPVGTHTFAPDFDQAVRVVLTLEGAQASRLTIQQGGNTFGGPRTTASATGPAGATAASNGATASTTTAPANPYVGRYALWTVRATTRRHSPSRSRRVCSPTAAAEYPHAPRGRRHASVPAGGCTGVQRAVRRSW